MKVWLDDIRPMPEEYDVWTKSAMVCISIIETGLVDHISLDHDLGNMFTGYTVACVIENLAYYNKIPRLTWLVHTQNPVGRDVITKTLQNADKYWLKKEKEQNSMCYECDPVSSPMCSKCIGS